MRDHGEGRRSLQQVRTSAVRKHGKRGGSYERSFPKEESQHGDKIDRGMHNNPHHHHHHHHHCILIV